MRGRGRGGFVEGCVFGCGCGLVVGMRVDGRGVAGVGWFGEVGCGGVFVASLLWSISIACFQLVSFLGRK